MLKKNNKNTHIAQSLLHYGAKPLGKNAAQASLEYLLTYGWALILIATIVGVLVLIISTGDIKYLCPPQTFAFICQGIETHDDTLLMRLQNKAGQRITINPFEGIATDGKIGYAVLILQGTEYPFGTVTIQPGETFTLSISGGITADQVSITYTDASGLTKTDTLAIGRTGEPTTETCNNGIDDADPDTDIDCADTECAAFYPGGCEYVESTLEGSPVLDLSANGDLGDTQTYKFEPTLPTDKRDSFQPASAQFSFYIESTGGPWNVIVGFDGDTKSLTGVTAGQWYPVELTSTTSPKMNEDASRSFTLKNESDTPLKIRAPVATIRIEKWTGSE